VQNNSAKTHTFIHADGSLVEMVEEISPSAAPDLSLKSISSAKWNWISFGATLATLMSGSALWEG